MSKSVWPGQKTCTYVLILKETQHFEKVVGTSHIFSVLNIIGNTIDVIMEGLEGQAPECELKLNKQ